MQTVLMEGGEEDGGGGGGRQAERQQRHQHAGGGGVVRRFRAGHALDRALAELLLPLGKPLFQHVGKEGGYFRAAGGQGTEGKAEEIGRASCRERVCQYV